MSSLTIARRYAAAAVCERTARCTESTSALCSEADKKTAELPSVTKCLKIDTQEAPFRNKEIAINSRG